MPDQYPSVCAVVATKHRPELLRRTLRSILAQDYPGRVQLCVVFDGVDIDPLVDIREQAYRTRTEVMAVPNRLSPGLAGARNTGIAAADTNLIAFCDDDDEWTPEKLTAQVALLQARPEAVAASGGIKILTRKGRIDRTPPPRVTREDLVRNRVATIHPSTLLLRAPMLQELSGPVDENIPSGYGEDYDLLLRVAEYGDVVSVQGVVGLIHWDRVSHFAGRWTNMAAGLEFLLDRHPDLLGNDRNAARMSGQIAFAHAAGGQKNLGRDWARKSRSHRWGEWRWVAASAVNRGLVKPDGLMKALNLVGRGV